MSKRSIKYKHKLLISCATITFALGVGVTTVSHANTVNVLTDVKSSYGRILFNWEQPVTITPSANGRELTIELDEAADVSLQRITQQMAPYIVTARQSEDKKRIILGMRDAYPIRHFQSGGNRNGVDVLFGGSPQPRHIITPLPTELLQPQQTDAETQAAGRTVAVNNKPPVKPISTMDVASQVLPKGAISTAEDAKRIDAGKPPVEKNAIVATTPKPQAPIATLAPQSIPVPIAKPKLSEPTQAVEEKATPKADTKALANAINEIPIAPAKPEAQHVAEGKSAPAAPKEAVKDTPKEIAKAEPVADANDKNLADAGKAAEQKANDTPRNMTVAVEKGRVTANLFFPFQQRTGVATFSLGKDSFIVFSNKAEIDLKKLASIMPSGFSELKEIPSEKGLVLQVTSNGGELFTTAQPSGKGYEWVVTLSRRPRNPKNIAVPQVLASTIIKPQFSLDMLQTTEPVEFTHPVSGQRIVAIPSYEPQKGVYPERMLSDITLLRTGQGVAYIPYDNSIFARKLRQGLRIGKPDGLIAMPEPKDVPAEVIMAAESGSYSFYPHDVWKANDREDYASKEQNLLKNIAFADDVKKAGLRLKLAQLYMSEGLHMEALTLLEMIQYDTPNFYEDNQLDAMAGAANFMLGRISTAKQYFNKDTIKDEEEMRLWHRLVEVMEGKRRSIDYFDFNRQFIRNYPPDMRRRLALLAADNALSQKKYNTVSKILQQMAEDNLMDEKAVDYGNYMMGRILAESGKLAEAEEYLLPLTEQLDNNLLRARSAFTLATARYKAGEISREELIAELDPLRLLWRGDAFELNLLNLLGELEVNNGNYAQGLRDWRDVVSYYPETQVAQEAAQRMAETFVDLFNRNKADSLTPLSALALYYEFRELTPLGHEGDVMIQNLADRLAGVDLLDRAASLLEHQVTFRLEKDERSRVGARLALIHLLNREPEKTLEVLELTGYGENDENLMRQRNHLAAMSYARLGKWQRAINSLRDDYSREAKFLRTDIYWDVKDWANVAQTVEDILATRPDITAPLNEEETEALLRLAIAYHFQNEPRQLQYLRDYFTPLISNADRAETFDFLTSGISPVSRDNIARLNEEMAKMKGFLDNYRISLGEQGLSAAFN